MFCGPWGSGGRVLLQRRVVNISFKPQPFVLVRLDCE